jgi:hypothetical protein
MFFSLIWRSVNYKAGRFKKCPEINENSICAGISGNLDHPPRELYNREAMRESPSGKAVAFQATIRGFESRLPL